MHNFKYDLGWKAKDKITGFEGVIVHRVHFITGCNQCGIQPVDKKGTVHEFQQFDENRLKILGKKPFVTLEEPKVKVRDKGGPQPNVGRC